MSETAWRPCHESATSQRTSHDRCRNPSPPSSSRRHRSRRTKRVLRASPAMSPRPCFAPARASTAIACTTSVYSHTSRVHWRLHASLPPRFLASRLTLAAAMFPICAFLPESRLVFACKTSMGAAMTKHVGGCDRRRTWLCVPHQEEPAPTPSKPSPKIAIRISRSRGGVDEGEGGGREFLLL